MSTAIATIENAGVAIDHQAILKSLNLDVRQPSTQALLLVCERYGLDPLLKHMVLISGNPYITRDGYLAIAHRSGVFDGMEVLEQGADQTHYTARVAVYRKDMGRPFTFIGRYPKAQRMAKDYGPEMAVKVAEVQALRRAFNVTGVGAADERWDEEAQEGGPKMAHTRTLERAEVVDTKALPPSNVDPSTGEIQQPASRKRKPPTAAPVPAEEPFPPAAEPVAMATEEDRDAIAMILKRFSGDNEARDALKKRWADAGIESFKAVERFTAADAEKALELLADFQIERADAAPTLDDVG